MPKYRLMLREIIVTPVIIEADSPQHAEELLMEGDGEYGRHSNTPSALSSSDFFSILEEEPVEIK